MKKRYTFILGFIVGLILGIGALYLFQKKVLIPGLNYLRLIRLQGYVTEQLVIDQQSIKALEAAKDSESVLHIQFGLDENFIRLIIIRQELSDKKYSLLSSSPASSLSDPIYNDTKVYLKTHPEAWNQIPNKELSMLPNDPILPATLNMYAFFQDELNIKNASAPQVTEPPK